MTLRQRLVRISCLLATTGGLYFGLAATTGFAQESTQGEEWGCYYCLRDAWGHHCQLTQNMDLGPLQFSCEVQYPGTPEERCHLWGIFCSSGAMLDSRSAVYLAASGSFAASSENTALPKPGADGFVRGCNGVVIGRVTQPSSTPLALAF